MDTDFMHYSVIRLTPDAVRRESINVGIICWGDTAQSVRVIGEITPAIRAIAAPNVRQALGELEDQIASMLKGRSLDDFKRLTEQGISGFELTSPKRLVPDREGTPPSTVAELLYQDYVAPRRWRHPSSSPGSRLDREVRERFLGDNSLNRQRLALGLTVRAPGVTHTFPVAYANGHTTIVQAVDLAVKEPTQEKNVNEAIAAIAETDRILRESLPRPSDWVAVVRRGPEGRGEEGRLARFAEVISSIRLDELVDRVRREADSDIESMIRPHHGLAVHREQARVEIDLEATA